MEEINIALLRGRRATRPPGPSARPRIHGWHEEEEEHAGGRGGRRQ